MNNQSAGIKATLVYNCKNNINNTENVIIKKHIDEYVTETSAMSDEEKNDYFKEICRRYYSGKKLTAKEMNYLRVYYPEMYLHAERTEMKRRILQEKLKHCRTKEQANQIVEEAHCMVSIDDPDKIVLHNVYNDVWKNFRKSNEYSGLKSEEKIEYSFIKKGVILWQAHAICVQITCMTN